MRQLEIEIDTRRPDSLVVCQRLSGSDLKARRVEHQGGLWRPVPGLRCMYCDSVFAVLETPGGRKKVALRCSNPECASNGAR